MKTKLAKFAFTAMTLASVLGLSAPVMAVDVSPEDISRYVKMTDVNKDGMVSKAEMMKRANAALAMSINKAGMVDSKAFMNFLLDLQKTDGGVTPSYTSVMMTKADMMKKIELAFSKADTAKKQMIDQTQASIFLAELLRSGG